MMTDLAENIDSKLGVLSFFRVLNCTLNTSPHFRNISTATIVIEDTGSHVQRIKSCKEIS